MRKLFFGVSDLVRLMSQLQGQARLLKLCLYSKTCLKWPLKEDEKMVFKTNDSLMQFKHIAECSHTEHSAIRLTCIKLPHGFKTFVLSIFEQPLKTGFKAVLLLWIIYVISVLCLLCFRACLFIDALWSPAGKVLTSWLSFVMSNCEVVTFPLVSWDSGVVLDCIHS